MFSENKNTFIAMLIYVYIFGLSRTQIKINFEDKESKVGQKKGGFHRNLPFLHFSIDSTDLN